MHRSSTGNHGGESGLNIFANDPRIVRIENPHQLQVGAIDIGARLLRLKKLLDQGATTREEYERLRKRLLDSIS